ncbi:hypothetical protein FOCC_FOCC009134 [Frankliniella occidentalis]|nr:hypothetical protein FOCC_FOCC009134 [Frankliniella occidentalis]
MARDVGRLLHDRRFDRQVSAHVALLPLQVYSSPLDLFVMNGTAVVDMFFVAGGCLLSWTLIGFHQQGRKSSLWALYLFRYARLIPAYAAAIAFLALELPSLGSGPLWGTTVLEEAQRCQRRWWTNLLFINNVFGQDEPVVMAIADTCFAFLAALVLHLLVEAPFSRLLSVLRGARTAPKQSGAAATGTGAP